MTIARRLNETVQLAVISFAAFYATAGLISLLSLSDRMGWMLICLVGFCLSLLTIIWLLARYAYRRFTQLGENEQALHAIQWRIWSICLILGLVSVGLAWLSGFRHLT